METRRLSQIPDDAVKVLAAEVNRLNGQVAALMAYIEAKEAGKPVSKADLSDEVAKISPEYLVPAIGPNVITDHARLTLAYMLDKKD